DGLAELDALIGPRFARAEPRERAMHYVRGLLSGEERKAPARPATAPRASVATPGRTRVRGSNHPEATYWLLARRSLTDPTDIAYYLCHAPARTSLATRPGGRKPVGGRGNLPHRQRRDRAGSVPGTAMG